MNNLVVVYAIYERQINELKSCQWALSSQGIQINGCQISGVIFFDNSHKPQKINFDNESIHYIHSPNNLGTAGAYEYAASLASKKNYEWILLLDQDTILPDDFLEISTQMMSEVGSNVGAILPIAIANDKVISPMRITSFGRIRSLDLKSTSSTITGIASGAIIRTKYLSNSFPLPVGLWLDYVDHSIFKKISDIGGEVVLGKAKIQQELSIANIRSLSDFRIRSILNGELIFAKQFGVFAVLLNQANNIWRIVTYCFSIPVYSMRILKWMLYK